MFFFRFFLFLIVSTLCWAKSATYVTYNPTSSTIQPSDAIVTAVTTNFNDNNQAMALMKIKKNDTDAYAIQMASSDNGGETWQSEAPTFYSTHEYVTSPLAINNEGYGFILDSLFAYDDTCLNLELRGMYMFLSMSLDRSATGTYSSLSAAMSDNSNKLIGSWVKEDEGVYTLFSIWGKGEQGIIFYDWVFGDNQLLLSSDTPITRVQCVLNDNDEAALIFIKDHLTYVMTSTDAGHTWSLPQVISSSNASYAQLTINNSGNLAAFWIVTGESSQSIIVRTSSDKGTTWAEPLTISNPDEYVTNFMAYMNANGQILLGYKYQLADLEQCVASVCSLNAGNTFTLAQTLWVGGGTVGNVFIDLNNINDLGQAFGAVSFSVGQSLMASYTYNAGVLCAAPTAVASNVQNNADLALNNTGAMIVSTINANNSFDTLTADLFTINLNSTQTKLLLQRDIVSGFQGTTISYATKYNIYDNMTGKLLFSGDTLSADLHAQLANNQSYFVTWTNTFGEESAPMEISIP